MKTLTGTYYKGKLKLDSPYNPTHPIRVKILINEEEQKELKLSDFSFLETQDLLKDCKSSFAEEVISERRKEH